MQALPLLTPPCSLSQISQLWKLSMSGVWLAGKLCCVLILFQHSEPKAPLHCMWRNVRKAPNYSHVSSPRLPSEVKVKLQRSENAARRTKERKNKGLSIGDICHISLLHSTYRKFFLCLKKIQPSLPKAEPFPGSFAATAQTCDLGSTSQIPRPT